MNDTTCNGWKNYKTWIVEQYTIIGGRSYVLAWLYDEEGAKDAAYTFGIHSNEYIYTAREATNTEMAQVNSLIEAGNRHAQQLKEQRS